MKKNYLILNLFILLIFILPTIVNAQAIKDSIRDNYTQQNYENFLLKKERGEIPRHDGPVSSSERSGNVLVNNNTGSTGTGLFTQSETSILAFGSNIVIGFNDSGSRDGDADKFTGWSYSSDGGASFTDGGTLPDDATGDAGDPVLARDETTGRIYFSTLGFTGDKTIQVFSSDDDGVTWSAPVNGTPGGNNEDKQWIVVDNFAGTGNGNVYLISRRFGGPGADQGIYVFYSTDNGATFLPNGGVKIASSGQGSYLAIAPDHSVYAFWMDASAENIQMRTSTDFGVTFGAAVTVVSGLTGPQVNNGLSLTGQRQGNDFYAGFRSNSFPHAAVNPVSGEIYLTYNDNPVGDDKADIFMVMSNDGGATWNVPVLVNDDGTTTDQWQPTIVVTEDGNNLGIFYSSREEDSEDNNLYKYYGRTATISGSTVTFSPSFAISDELSLPEFGRDNQVNSTYMGDYNHAAASGGMYHLVWADNRDDLADGGDRKDPNVYYKSISVIPNSPPVASCQDVNVSAEGDCFGHVTADQVNDGSFDPDGDPITLILDPPGPYILGETEVTLTVSDGDLTDVCSATITVIDDTPPSITCPADIYIGNDPGLCSAFVEFDVTATDNCDATVTIVSSPASRSTFPVGTTTVTTTATDNSGNTAECSFDVIVSDVEAPVITVNSEPLVLWSPNHKYETIYIQQIVADVSDNCDVFTINDIDITDVSSDEPDDAPNNGDGKTINDIVIAPDCKSVDLRSERQGGGNGRVYEINIYVADAAGNIGTAVFQVMVPHDEDHYPAVNDGPDYTVHGNCSQAPRGSITINDTEDYMLINYPNPFSKTTTIQFTLKNSNYTKLVVYNALGREVITLFEGMAEAERTYELEFNGIDLRGGLYFYNLQSGESINMLKKMMLIK